MLEEEVAVNARALGGQSESKLVRYATTGTKDSGWIAVRIESTEVSAMHYAARRTISRELSGSGVPRIFNSGKPICLVHVRSISKDPLIFSLLSHGLVRQSDQSSSNDCLTHEVQSVPDCGILKIFHKYLNAI